MDDTTYFIRCIHQIVFPDAVAPSDNIEALNNIYNELLLYKIFTDEEEQ
jgi:hypothetical protein